MNWLSPRSWYVAVFLCCSALLGFAIYNQYVEFVDPCPLCVLQRVAFAWMGLVALAAAVHRPGRTGERVYAWLVAFGALMGALVAGRHVWLQNLPPGEVPECGPGLNYMLENFPLTEALSAVLMGSGSCAEVKWTFLGMTMPMWTLAWFVGLGLATVWVVYRGAGKQSA